MSYGYRLPFNKMEKSYLAILKVLSECRGSTVSSREIAEKLKPHGITLSERTVRYHLRILEERGLTGTSEKGGRHITQKGRHVFSKALVSELDFLISMMK